MGLKGDEDVDDGLGDDDDDEDMNNGSSSMSDDEELKQIRTKKTTPLLRVSSMDESGEKIVVEIENFS